MSAGFTPAPWKVFGIRARFATVSQADALGRPSRHVAEMAWDNLDEHAPHDAALIAAAPELYDVLKTLRLDLAEEDAERHAQRIAVIDLTLAGARGE